MKSYQDEDRHLLDYGLQVVPGLEQFGRAFRGPVPTDDGFIACLGAAQTFGRLCPEPYPALLSRHTGIPTLNLGVGGAGPALFLRPDMREVLRRASLCVVQVMSGRSQSTRRFRTDGNMHGRRVSDGALLTAEEYFEDVLENCSRQEVDAIAGEFRQAYVADMARLLTSLQCPTILFWFSVRRPRYQPRYDSVVGLFGDFPQLVSDREVTAMVPFADSYVECVTSAGLPHDIRTRDGAKASIVLDYRLLRPERYSITVNTYYPSPEMHGAAARQLAGECLRLAATAGSRSGERQ